MFELKIDDHIRVRTIHPDDTEELFALMEKNRSHLRPWIHASALPETIKATRIFAIECYLNSMEDPMEALDSPYFEETGQYLRGFADPPMEMGIWLDGCLVGAISLMFLEDSPTSGEFGYWITAEQEGKGIVTRCVTALMDYAVDQLQVEQFLIGCAVSNRRSRAIPERLGYQLKETISNGEVIGEYVYDRLVFGLPASLWRARREATEQEHKP